MRWKSSAVTRLRHTMSYTERNWLRSVKRNNSAGSRRPMSTPLRRARGAPSPPRGSAARLWAGRGHGPRSRWSTMMPRGRQRSEAVEALGVGPEDELALRLAQRLRRLLELGHDARDLGVGVRVVRGPDDAVGT